ncbi:MAG: class I SAM-dependent methyltransferase [Anaerolineae bacterium]|jgi:predicted O-methyltransferase YrrM|nr:class I SAM-dependent methyltransferase [Anaerolineae bacterium]
MDLYKNCLQNLPENTLDVLKHCQSQTECMLSFEEGVLLYCLAKELTSGCIIEIGSYRGGSTVFLGRGSLDGAQIPVYAIDPHKDFIGVLGGVFGPKDRTAFYRAMLDLGCSEIVSLVNLSSEYFAYNWKEAVSLLWIDGDHNYDAVKRDFELWIPHVKSGSKIVFDDAVDPNLGPRKLLDELIASEKFEEIERVGKIVVVREKKTKGK